MVAKLSGAKVRVGAGLGSARVPGALTVEVPPPPDARPVTWHWSMARAVARVHGGDEAWPEESPPPDLTHLLAGGPMPRGSRRRIVVHSGASRYLNQWDTGHFAAAAGSLSRDFEVVWIEHGGTTGAAPEGCVRAPVGSLGELARWLAGADLFLGNNSGPMHLANALGCPGVVVTGPSARGWDPYWHRGRWTVLRHPSLSCAPCERITEELAGCANTASPMACLTYWSPERVETECRRRLERPGGDRP
jgi:ADP-heptose:LPS heptosyltransferase